MRMRMNENQDNTFSFLPTAHYFYFIPVEDQVHNS